MRFHGVRAWLTKALPPQSARERRRSRPRGETLEDRLPTNLLWGVFDIPSALLREPALTAELDVALKANATSTKPEVQLSVDSPGWLTLPSTLATSVVENSRTVAASGHFNLESTPWQPFGRRDEDLFADLASVLSPIRPGRGDTAPESEVVALASEFFGGHGSPTGTTAGLLSFIGTSSSLDALLPDLTGPSIGIPTEVAGQQANPGGTHSTGVTMLRTPAGDVVTLDAGVHHLTNVKVDAPPDGADVALPWGLFSFMVTAITPGGTASVEMVLPDGANPARYFKQDAATGDFTPFDFNGTTGAEIHGNVVTLHFLDGGRGDADGVANGVIVDPGGPDNNPPDAQNDSYADANYVHLDDDNVDLTVLAPGVLANDTDPDGDALTASVVTNPAYGSLGLELDGRFNYAPNSPKDTHPGVDSFTYQASDGRGGTDTASATLTISDPYGPDDKTKIPGGTPAAGTVIQGPGKFAITQGSAIFISDKTVWGDNTALWWNAPIGTPRHRFISDWDELVDILTTNYADHSLTDIYISGHGSIGGIQTQNINTHLTAERLTAGNATIIKNKLVQGGRVILLGCGQGGLQETTDLAKKIGVPVVGNGACVVHGNTGHGNWIRHDP